MKKYRNQLDRWLDEFASKFGYFPRFPEGLYVDNDGAEVNRKFIESLKHSVETGVDETITVYGTPIPSKKSVWDGTIID